MESVIFNEAEFPRASHTVSETISNNDSTSQASICGSTLTLMDVFSSKGPISGIAMGLLKREDKTTGYLRSLNLKKDNNFFN